jgi:hypothetical protein
MSGTAAGRVVNRNENANQHDLRSPLANAQFAAQGAVAISAATGEPTGLVFLRDTELSVAENAGTATARISRVGSFTNEVSITYGITSNTAIDGEDFVGRTATVIMPANVAEVVVQIPIINNTRGEATETFAFSLIDVIGANLWAPRTMRISILDDENLRRPRLWSPH